MANSTPETVTHLTHKAYVETPKAIALGDLAHLTGAMLQGDPNTLISGVGTLQNAKPGTITFLSGARYRHFLATTQASGVILTADEFPFSSKPALICNDPKLVFAQVVELLFPRQTLLPGIHPSAVIDPQAEIHPMSHIGPYCVVGKNARIEKNVILQSHCYVGNDCVIGEGTVLYPQVTVYALCRIGQSCTLHAGVVIGSDGFGFAKQQSRWVKVPHVAGVCIGDRVEIGANTTIDRGVIEDTTIGSDVILDNLIQIGHNVKIGDGTAIAACVGIAGSTEVGKNCLIGGGSSINGHIQLTDQVNLVGCSNVAQSVTQAGTYGSATTIMDMKKWKKTLVRYHQLEEFAQRLAALEKQLESK